MPSDDLSANQHSSRAVVVGAGPAGALLAYLLARRGVAVTLLERQTDFSREFRGEVLMPSGITALHEAGLRQKFSSLPHQALDTVELFRAERRLVSIPLANIYLQPLIVP
jgi:2-polyprenyl-6-methoxyphenol hydroxylase-like FAD-dependent oxidoreductase